MWILIRWLRQKPADLDLLCFSNKDKSEFSMTSIQFNVAVHFKLVKGNNIDYSS